MKNRFMLAPMTNTQSHADGRLSDDEYYWLTMRAEGGFAITMTCASHVQAIGQGFDIRIHFHTFVYGGSVGQHPAAGADVLALTDSALSAIADEALKRKSGARGLRAILETCMLDIMYELPSNENVKECVIGEDVILNNEDPILLYEQTKKQA